MKTSIGCLQCGHVIRPVSEGAQRTSSSQALHLKCIMASMKPLMLLSLLAVSVQAQTIADAARQERARQARIRSEQAVSGKTTETITNTPVAPSSQTPPVSVLGNPATPATPGTPAAPGTPGTPATPGATAATPASPATAAPAGPGQPRPAPAAAPAPPRPPAPPPVDPAAKWNEEMGKIRARVRDLQDQEQALQLQVNQLTSQFLAPVSDQASKDQAQSRLGDTQNRLTAVRAELDQARKTLDSMQLQGPPKQ